MFFFPKKDLEIQETKNEYIYIVKKIEKLPSIENKIKRFGSRMINVHVPLSQSSCSTDSLHVPLVVR